MKLKIVLSSLIMCIFALLGGASFDDNGNIAGWVWLIVIGIVVVFVFSFIQGTKEEKKKQELRAQERELRLKQEAEQKAKFDEWYENYKSSNGLPDKMIVITPNNENELIIVHENNKKVYINGKTFNFKDIISCTFSDSPTTIKGKVTATTKSKTGSTVGRAIVGDVIAGPAGAIIGGTTGKKTTEFHQENDRTIHDYTVIINVNSISNPIIRINTGSKGTLTNEIVGLMNVIISRK